MAHFKTLRAIPEDEYDRLLSKKIRDYDPELNNKVKIEKEISAILANPGLNPEEKIRLIQAVTFTNEKEVKLPNLSSGLQEERGTAPAPGAAPPPAPAAASGSSQAEEEEDPEPQTPMRKSASYLNLTTRRKADHLVEFIDHQAPDITTNDQNQLFVKGKKVKDSNITDILNYMFNPRKASAKAPVGTQNFLNSLKDAGVPSYLVGNKVAQAFLKAKSKSSSLSSSTPQEGKGRRKRPIAFACFTHPKLPRLSNGESRFSVKFS